MAEDLSGLSDLLDGLAGRRRPTPGPTPERGVQLRGRKIDGDFYVRGEDVIALLELNGLLPETRARMKRAMS